MTAPLLKPTSQGALQLASSFRLQVNTAYNQDLAVQLTPVWRTVFDVIDFTPGTPEWDKIDTTTYDDADPASGIVTKSQRKVAQSRTASGQRLRISHGDPDENAGWQDLRDRSKNNRLAQARWFNASDPTEPGEMAIVDVTYDRQGGAAADKGVDAFSLELQGVAESITNPQTGGVVPNATSVSPTSAAANTMVVISGTGLAGVNSVLFGSTPAVHIWPVNDTTLHAVVPTGTTGSQPITVASPGGTDGTTVAFSRT